MDALSKITGQPIQQDTENVAPLTRKFIAINQASFFDQQADMLMQMYLYMLITNNATMNEEVFLCISSLATALGVKFMKYMEALKPFLLQGLKNKEEQSVCTVSVSLLADLCTALEDNISTYTDEIMGILLRNLFDDDIGKRSSQIS